MKSFCHIVFIPSTTVFTSEHPGFVLSSESSSSGPARQQIRRTFKDLFYIELQQRHLQQNLNLRLAFPSILRLASSAQVLRGRIEAMNFHC